MWKLRRILHALDPSAAIEILIDGLKQNKSNAQFLGALQKNSR